MYYPSKVRDKNFNFWGAFCMGKYSTEFKITIKIYFSKIACNKNFLKLLLK